MDENEESASAASNDRNAGENVQETNVTTGSPSLIKEFSETISAEDDSNDLGEEKERSKTAASESIDERQQEDRPKPRTAADEEYERDSAQRKKNRRARRQPGAKRGGRRETRRGGWGGLLVKKKIQFEAGDLIEAEWRTTGWWYVGYVQGDPEGQEGSNGAAAAKSRARKQDLFHVVFADGDEADVPGKNLKRLEPMTDKNGQPTGSGDGQLPRHVPVADLGSGRLHCNVDLPLYQNQGSKGGWGWGRRPENKTTNSNVDTNNDGNNGDKEETKPLARRRSVGNIDSRTRQGEQAVWGRCGPPGGSPAGGDGGGSGGANGSDMEWWETGTRYAFQPRLAADKATVLSFVDSATAGGRSGRGGGTNEREGPRFTSGSRDGVVAAEEFTRIVQVPKSNENHGQRVFFVAA